MTVAALLRARAGDDRPGLRSADDGRTWTWREVVRQCAARAAWMNAARRPDRPVHVGVLLDNTPELVFLLGGAALSGAVVVALNHTRSADELAGDAERADCDLIVTQPRHAGLAAAIGGPPVHDIETPDYEALLAPHEGAEPPDDGGITEQTLLMLIFTSGTSGRPRAVQVTHRKVTIPGENLAERMLSPEAVVYCPMPLFHSGAIMAAYAPALAAGAELVLRGRFSASGMLPDVREHGCTYLHYVGKALSYVLATPAQDDDADNPLKFAFGNEAAPLEQKAFGERFGCFVIDGYGSTETAIALSPDPFGPQGALGKLTPGIKVLDPETGSECPPGRFDDAGRLLNGEEAIGELVNTQGLGLFDGYYNEDAPDRLRDGMFWSGDHAYVDAEGYVFFAGRTADRLRVDGENFGAAQVERALAELPGVRQLAVYGVPDEAAGDQVMLALAADDFDPDAFADYLRGRKDLGPKWPPRYIRVARELPATASNKILKRRLVRDGWQTDDPVWWRPGRDLAYRRMTPQDVARLRTEFDKRGRLHLLEGSK
ncbi:AMP-binding protein [Actinomadura barringtoniae]|uniref:AMP-binding protein n=1 Tax=Actinomadura barringtoniae TaxID=1427535 RepID=A0A939PCR5_9ACTN|nr:AMP-binding protein [Actinomadura barringtoniae]MBO2450447.1 AMP-binding protein [Actinomadura barringtoniae]